MSWMQAMAESPALSAPLTLNNLNDNTLTCSQMESRILEPMKDSIMKKIYTIAALALGFMAFATNHAISVVNNSFSPAALTITAGDTVTWTQVNGVHNVNGSTSTFSTNPSSFGNGAAAGGTWTYQYVFTTPGSYQYQCDPHASFMTGSATVTAAATRA
ncbi:MAG TPA: hypothetical protein DCE58_04320, partial [Cryomorphaceae bacterium]|nr:hypothetical protein [Cryomorphaceae bacterium]